MPRGCPIDWTDELVAKLKSLYPMHLDSEVAEALGLNYKSVRNKAKALGLKKGDGYEEYYKKTQARIRYISGKYMRNSGQFKKGNKPVYTFPKGEPPKEWVDKRVATIKRQYYEDSVRMKYGLEPKMKFHRPMRYYLKKDK